MADAGLRNRLVGCVGTGCAIVLLAVVPALEGTVHETYLDSVGIVTACDGHTGPELKLGQKFTPAQCEEMLVADLIKHAEPVLKCTPGLEGHDYELASAVSIAFNIGVTNYCNSTMAKKFNAKDFKGACAEFPKWNKAGGKVLRGLVKRRAIEQALCEGRVADAQKLLS